MGGGGGGGVILEPPKKKLATRILLDWESSLAILESTRANGSATLCSSEPEVPALRTCISHA
eukprot:715759-Amphidinium_carterae.1